MRASVKYGDLPQGFISIKSDERHFNCRFKYLLLRLISSLTVKTWCLWRFNYFSHLLRLMFSLTGENFFLRISSVFVESKDLSASISMKIFHRLFKCNPGSIASIVFYYIECSTQYMTASILVLSFLFQFLQSDTGMLNLGFEIYKILIQGLGFGFGFWN